MFELVYFSDWVLLAARVVVGMVMIYYGYPKIKDLKANGEDFVKMGFRPGIFWGTIVALTEFVGGIFLLAGILVEFVALAIAVEMILGTLKKLKWGKDFKDYSYDLLILSIALLLIAFGPGTFALTPSILS